MSNTSQQPTGIVAVELPRTIGAVKEALPPAEAAEFAAVVESTEVVELPGVFEHWYRLAVLSQVPGLRERISSGRGSGTGNTVPAEEVFPGFEQRLADRRAAA
jgi:hypothetical protein